MVKRFNTPDCESGMHEFEPRYPPQYEINSLAVRPNFFCLKVILRFLLTFSGGGVNSFIRHYRLLALEVEGYPDGTVEDLDLLHEGAYRRLD